MVVGDGGVSALVDTPYTSLMRSRMMAAMGGVRPDAVVDTIIHTHANGDHTFTSAEFGAAHVIGTRSSQEHLHRDPTPEQMQALVHGPGRDGPLVRYLRRHFGHFDFSGLALAPTTRSFAGELAVTVGGTELRLIEVGPAHTAGDAIVHLPRQRVVCTGDIVFLKDHPVHWAGPIARVLDACARILALAPEVIVPGHGPVAEPAALREYTAYLRYVRDRIHEAHGRGLSVLDTAASILAEGRYGHLALPERLVVLAGVEQSHLDGTEPPGILGLLTRAAEFAERRSTRVPVSRTSS
ncbi:hypothetical protein GCM10018793_49290 [Streptomyces sulfonofaciens]|uniref:Metallo-beta-lactamase domain-containing protein n=2 Tax=Streptomyces sulfonofaciens TaxID=68272 RepID=A0A919GGZ9_9ACTN|nr:hypothetical protein GCM10018793_49290 [Streptomyces sulfonofaciens]